MTKLLEIKKQVFRFWGKYETYLRFVYKFIIAFVLFTLINESIGVDLLCASTDDDAFCWSRLGSFRPVCVIC